MAIEKITQKRTREFLKEKLSKNPKWALKALVKIYEFQTAEEQENEHTYDHNGVGFTGVDGNILSSFAKQYLKYHKLSEKQMNLLLKKMPKYWKQIVSISDEDQLNNLILQS
jgi:hypothetical protein